MKNTRKQGFAVHRNPELSLSPKRMLGPIWTSFCTCVYLSAFLMDAPDVYTHCTLGIDQPFEAKSLVHTSLQPFRPVRSVLQCNTRACSPTRGIYHIDVVEDIVCRKQDHYETGIPLTFLTYFCLKIGGILRPADVKHRSAIHKNVN